MLLHVLIGEGEHIVVDDEDSASVLSWIEDQRPTETSFWSKLKDLLKGTSQNNALLRDAETAAGVDQPQKLSVTPIAQHYHPDRSLIHNQINSMRSSNLTVAVEQVSIFLTNDGTVITFFQVRLQVNNMADISNRGEQLRNPLRNDLVRKVLFFEPQKTPLYYSKV